MAILRHHRWALLNSSGLVLLGVLLGAALRPASVSGTPPAQAGVDQRLTDLEQRVTAAENDVDQLFTEIGSLSGDVTDLQTRVAAIEDFLSD